MPMPTTVPFIGATAERDVARLEAIEAVRSAGLSQRVAADVVGLSHQRVHQLVNS